VHARGVGCLGLGVPVEEFLLFGVGEEGV